MLKIKYPQILFEDSHIMVINKPSGIAVQSDITGDLNILKLMEYYIIEKYNKLGAAYLGMVHRLDRPVSGALILAKRSKAMSRMTEQFRLKTTKKIYHAISEILLDEKSGTLIHYLGKDNKKNRAIVHHNPTPNAKEAILHYTWLQSKNGKHLYEVQLETGRFHQIRAQMNNAGATLIGDVKYSAQFPLPDKSIGLHAKSISFNHPMTNERITIEAPYPNTDWWKIWDK